MLPWAKKRPLVWMTSTVMQSPHTWPVRRLKLGML
jgi:hypothetical protein